jgi:hypothetical protein
MQLDADTWFLKRIHFRYDGVDGLSGAEHQGGTLLFAPAGTARWIVTQWSLRVPLLREGPLRWSARSRSASRSRAVVGYLERAGRVLESQR